MIPPKILTTLVVTYWHVWRRTLVIV